MILDAQYLYCDFLERAHLDNVPILIIASLRHVLYFYWRLFLRNINTGRPVCIMGVSNINTGHINFGTSSMYTGRPVLILGVQYQYWTLCIIMQNSSIDTGRPVLILGVGTSSPL